MAHYRKVETKIWNDARFLSLSPHGKLAYLFILTHPHMTALGAMRTTVPGLTFELPDVPAKAFREVFGKGLAQADERACMIWLPKFLYYNTPESPNVIRSWTNAFDLLPDCELKEKLLETMKAFTKGLTEGFRQAFNEGFDKALAKSLPKTSPNPEQEQEQEQENKEPPPPPLERGALFSTEKINTKAHRKAKSNPDYPPEFLDFYNLYPRHTGKDAALTAWKKAVKRVEPKIIMKALSKQVEANFFSDDMQFVKYPAAWLNAGCWEDEITSRSGSNGRPTPYAGDKWDVNNMAEIEQ